MTAPTEAEILNLLAARIARYPGDDPESTLHLAVAQHFDLIDYLREPDPATDEMWEQGDDVWTDLRPSEAERLHELVVLHRLRAERRAAEIIRDELCQAAVTFATEHPNAPRGVPEFVPA